MEERYYKRDISRIIGKPVRTIQYWTDQGIVIPDVEAPQGKGKARVYSKRNLIEFAMVELMSSGGLMQLDLLSIKAILHGIREGHVWTYHFEDFYENPVWGRDKELVYFEHEYFAKIETGEKVVMGGDGAGTFHVIPRTGDEFIDQYRAHLSCKEYDVSFEPKRPLRNNLIFMGAIKKSAMELFNIPE